MAGETLIVVDDSAPVRALLTALLEARGYVVRAYERGAEALEAARAAPPDMFLLDVEMPEMDGFALCGALKGVDALRDIPVLFVSALDDVDDKVRAFTAGAVDYVTKPIQADELRARVRTHLDLRRKTRELQESYREVLAAKARAETLAAERDAYSRFVRQTFGRYLSDDIVTSLLESPQGLDFEAHTREVSVLVADLRGFTGLVERMAAVDVVTLLNMFLGTMAEVVADHDGTIGDFVGDAVMVIFGAPLARSDHARAALRCAVDMQDAMAGLNARLAERRLPFLEMGVGIATGEVVVGNIGSVKHAKYGVVGFHVNLASRVQSYATGGQVLATEATVRAAGDGVVVGARLRVEPKGVSEPLVLLSIHEVDGRVLPDPGDERLVPLPAPVPLRFFAVDDKHVEGAGLEGAIVAMSDRGLALQAAGVPGAGELKLDFGGAVPPVYARVVGGAPGLRLLRFTSLPCGVADLRAMLLYGAG